MIPGSWGAQLAQASAALYKSRISHQDLTHTHTHTRMHAVTLARKQFALPQKECNSVKTDCVSLPPVTRVWQLLSKGPLEGSGVSLKSFCAQFIFLITRDSVRWFG